MSTCAGIVFRLLVVAAPIAGMLAAHAETVSIACLSGGLYLELCQKRVKIWAEETGHDVKMVSTPNSSTEALTLYQQLLSARAADVDVFMIDVIWPGLLGSHLVDLGEYAGDVVNDHFPSIIEGSEYQGRLVSMPWFTNAGLLYYRKDLLEKYGGQAPATWAELADTAKRIQDAERAAGNHRMWGYVWQGRAYEGLTCVALEWIASHNGGTIVEADGTISVNNAGSIEAIETAAGWIGTISPPGVLSFAEEDARMVFQSGDTVFMRNWPYAWALANADDSPIEGRVGVTVLPKGGQGGRHAAALGGWNLAVSKYSRHKDISADLVMFLTSAEEQKFRAIDASLLPTIEHLYKDPEVLKAVPFIAELYEVLISTVARPSAVTGARYSQVSREFWNSVHAVLSSQDSAEDALERLESALQRISFGGKW